MAGEIKSMINSDNIIEIEPENIRLVAAVPQPTAPPRAPSCCTSELVIRATDEEAKEKRLITVSTEV